MKEKKFKTVRDALLEFDRSYSAMYPGWRGYAAATLLRRLDHDRYMEEFNEWMDLVNVRIEDSNGGIEELQKQIQEMYK